jgi:hypothetical protein
MHGVVPSDLQEVDMAGDRARRFSEGRIVSRGGCSRF